MPLGMEVGIGTGDLVLDGDPAPPVKGAQPPVFGPCLLWPLLYGDEAPLLKGHSSPLFSAHV